MSHRLTPEERDAAACEWAERTALAQGLPAKIEDPAWLNQLATFMTTPARHSPAAGGRAANPTLPPGSPPSRSAPDVAADAGRASTPAA